MRKTFSILLLGVLSTFFAEVFSGASTLWFLSVWGLFVTMPLYLGHSLFFFNLATRTSRTSLRQLYFFGMIFGLYEAFITKVLWYGYPDSTGAMMGYFIGVAWGEFLTLVLFWHPVMSFILPILVYELLSKDHIAGHEWLLKKNRQTLLVSMIIIMIGAVLQSNGSRYNVLVSVGSMAGSLIIIIILNRFSEGKSVQSLILRRKGMITLILYLSALYGVTTVFLLNERLPSTFTPYVSILICYIVALFLIWIDRYPAERLMIEGPIFSFVDLRKFIEILLGATVLFSLVPTLSYAIMIVFFVSFMFAGIALFSTCLYSLFKKG